MSDIKEISIEADDAYQEIVDKLVQIEDDEVFNNVAIQIKRTGYALEAAKIARQLEREGL